MKVAFVTTNLLDMRARPDHHAERINQLLFADLVNVGTERGGFARVRKWDGYESWADARFLGGISKRRAIEYSRIPAVTVISLQARLVDADTKNRVPHVLYYGTRLAVERLGGSWAHLILPDGSRVRLKATAIRSVSAATDIRGSDVIREARKFLGVPYLWGGITSPGLDCSGLVQTVYRRLGINLPRDTKDQIKVGESVDRARITTGDILFFPGHVAVALSADRIIHSSRGASGVRIESLSPESPAYRLDLVTSFKEARRII